MSPTDRSKQGTPAPDGPRDPRRRDSGVRGAGEPRPPAVKAPVRVEFRPDLHDESPLVHPVRAEYSVRGKNVLTGILLFAAALVAMLPVGAGKFIHLDVEYVSHPAYRTWPGMLSIWTAPQRMPEFSPVSFTLLALEHRVFQGRPAGYHLVSLLLHAVNTVLAWTLLRRLSVPAALFGAAVFAVHPVHVDAVAWVAQQKVLLCATLYIGALLSWLRFDALANGLDAPGAEASDGFSRFSSAARSRLWYALSFALLSLALLTHALAASFPLVLLVLRWWQRDRFPPSRRRFLATAPFAAAALGVFAVGVYVDVFRNGARGPEFPAGVFQRVQLIGLSISHYAVSLLMPLRLSFAPDRWKLDAGNVWLYVPFLLLILVLAIGIAVTRGRGRVRNGDAAAAAILLYVAALLPVSGVANFAWMRHAWVADHLQYLAALAPLAAFAALCGAAWRGLTSRLASGAGVMGRLRLASRGGLVAACAMVVALSVVSIGRSRAYASPDVLWLAVLADNPRSVRAHNTLGRAALDDRADAKSAYEHFRAALEVAPDDVISRLNLADAMQARREFDRAIAEYFRLLKDNPRNTDARFGLAAAYHGSGDTTAAAREYEAVLAARPDDVKACLNLANVYSDRGETDLAISTLRRAIELSPRYTAARVNLATILFRRGDLNGAASELTTALTVDPSSFEACFSAGACLGTLATAVEDPSERRRLNRLAERAYRQAIYLKPASADAQIYLGIVLARQSRDEPRERAVALLSEAIACFRRAAALNPDESSRALELADLAERDRARAERS